MVRKATLDRSLRPDETAAADEAVPGATESAEVAEERPAPRRSAGGRWTVWAFRALLWAVLLIIGFRGIAEPFVVGFVDIGWGGEGAAVFSGINYPF